MSITKTMLKDDGVYWAPASTGFSEFGKPLLDDPIAVTVRWVAVQEEFIDAAGTKQVSRAKVYVSQDVAVGGLLLQAPLSDTDESFFPANPKEYAGVYEIRSFEKTKSLSGGRIVRVVHL